MNQANRIFPRSNPERKLKSAIRPTGQTRRTFIRKTAVGIAAPLVFSNLDVVLADEESPSGSNSNPLSASFDPIKLGISKYKYRKEMINTQKPITWKSGWDTTVTADSSTWQTLPHDPAPSGGGAPPNYITIMIQLSKKPPAEFIKFRVKSGDTDADNIEIVDDGFDRNTTNGTVKIKVKAKYPSRKKVGVEIEGYYTPSGSREIVVSAGKIPVVKPKSLNRTIGNINSIVSNVPLKFYAEFEGTPVISPQDTGKTTVISPYYSAIMTVSVKDQFGDPLDNCYNGTGVEEETSDWSWVAWCDGSTYKDIMGGVEALVSSRTITPDPSDPNNTKVNYSSVKALPWEPSAENVYVRIAGWPIENLGRTRKWEAVPASPPSEPGTQGNPYDKVRMIISW